MIPLYHNSDQESSANSTVYYIATILRVSKATQSTLVEPHSWGQLTYISIRLSIERLNSMHSYESYWVWYSKIRCGWESQVPCNSPRTMAIVHNWEPIGTLRHFKNHANLHRAQVLYLILTKNAELDVSNSVSRGFTAQLEYSCPLRLPLC